MGVALRHRAAPAVRRRVIVVRREPAGLAGWGAQGFCAWRLVSPVRGSADPTRVAGAEEAGRTPGLSAGRVRLEAVADAGVSHWRRGRELALDAALRAPTARAAAFRGRFPEEERCARTPGRPWEAPWGLGAADQVCGCALSVARL